MLHFSTKTFSFSSRRHKQQQRRGHFTFISHPPNYRSTHTPADLTVSLPTSLLQLWSEPRPSKAGHTPRPTITTTEETAGEHPAPPPLSRKKGKKQPRCLTVSTPHTQESRTGRLRLRRALSSSQTRRFPRILPDLPLSRLCWRTGHLQRNEASSPLPKFC